MKGNRVVLQAGLALVLVLLQQTYGYAGDTPTFDMETIIVQADRDSPQTVAEQPAVDKYSMDIHVVSPDKAKSVPELLRQAAGIDVQMRTLAGDNQDGTVKLRGFDARRYTVLIDGLPIMMSGVMAGNYIDWNTIPLAAVDKIEITRGAKSAAYGNTLGGVINIITKERAENGGDIRVTYGNDGQYQRLLDYGGHDAAVDWHIFVNQFGMNGELKNNDYDAYQYGLGLKYALSDEDSIKFDFRHTKARYGYIVANIPGTGSYDSAYPDVSANAAEGLYGGAAANPGAYWEKNSDYGDIAWRHKTAAGFWQLNYWRNREKRHELNYSVAGVLNLDQTIIADKSQGLQFDGSARQGRHTYGYGLDYKQLRYGDGWRDVGTATDIYPSQKIDLFGLYLEDTWKLDNRWQGNIGLRYDRMSGGADDARAAGVVKDSDAAAISPKINFSFRNNDEMITFMSINRLWRAPSMAEFYWWSMPDPPAKLGTDRQLNPEKGWGYEVGVSRRMSPAWHSKLTLYYQDISDYINFTHQWPFSCYNIDRAKLWGLEWENSYVLNKKAQLLFSYTNQHTKKSGVAGNDLLGLSGELDYRPTHKATLAYQYDAKPWQLRYELAYTGQQTANYPYGTANVLQLGGYVIHNFAVVHTAGTAATVALNINNLFNRHYFEQYPYEMSGRTFTLSYDQKI